MRRSPPSALERSLIYAELLLDPPPRQAPVCPACGRPSDGRTGAAQKLADKAAYP